MMDKNSSSNKLQRKLQIFKAESPPTTFVTMVIIQFQGSTNFKN